ncbi:MAG: YggT family protein, partial [Alicyclobacillus sp.]|nr:YggT family protein [Alicyclobacillus sp.]
CLVTSGPAATNLVTALQDASMDSIPIVAFTGQVPTHLIGNDAFQEADNVGITRPCTKHNYLVKDGRDLGPVIREAFHIAATGRPGPVHIDLPKDILVKETELVWPERVALRSYNPTYDGHPGQIRRAARLIATAERPVLYVGGGVISADAHEELRELAELTEIPVTTTLMGLGAFPSEHRLALDMLGMHGTYYANMAVHHSDVLIAVAVISWLPDLAETRFGVVLQRMAEPYLQPFRKYIPSLPIGGVQLDVSFIVAVIVYFLLQEFVLSVLTAVVKGPF